VSTLTKVFLVLVAVLSVALATLTIAANGMAHNWKKSAEDWKAAALAAQAKERVVAVQAKLTHEQDLDKIRRISAELERARQEQVRLAQALESRSIDVAELQNQVSSLAANITGLRESLMLVQSQLAREQDFGRRLATRNAELERRNIDLNDRTKELTASLAMAHTQVRALQQQIAAMQEAEVRMGLRPSIQVPGEGVVEAFVPAVQPQLAAITAPIRGAVTKVRHNIASISVGSADGVSLGMRFLIYRPSRGEEGPQYLGTLQVTAVEANQSAGTLIRAVGDIRPGDQATDEASFAMRQ
jgi:hypothetical protein